MPLVKYTGSNVVGITHDTKTLEIWVDVDFIPFANIVNDSAKAHGLKVIVISSDRKTTNVPSAIVVPAKLSNHLIASAWDINVIIIATNEYYNSTALQTCVGVVRAFLNDVKSKGLRWGGDFKTPDPVHLDSGINVFYPDIYKKKYKEYIG